MKRLKILFLLDSLGGGGFERRMTQLIMGLSEDKDYAEVYVLLPQNARVIRKEALHYDCQYIYYDGRADILRKLSVVKPDIIHCCSPVNSFIVNIYRASHNCKYVAGFVADANRPPFFSKKNFGFEMAYLFSDAIVGNSKAGLDAYRCPSIKAHVIYNGFDPRRLDIEMPSDLKEIRENNPFVISMVAAFRDDKDYYAYIDVASSLRSNSDILFLTAGLGPNENAIKEYSKQKQCSNVVFLGYRMDVINVFKISDISLLLSNQSRHKEGVSNSIMESMAVGTPVIATSGGGTNEIIRNGLDGFILENNNVDTVVESINKLYENKELRHSMSQECAKRVKEDFSLETMISRYKELYNKIS